MNILIIQREVRSIRVGADRKASWSGWEWCGAFSVGQGINLWASGESTGENLCLGGGLSERQRAGGRSREHEEGQGGSRTAFSMVTHLSST